MTKTSHQSVGLILKQGDPQVAGALQAVVDVLSEQQCRILIDNSNPVNALEGTETADIDTIKQSCQLIIVIGGDGTLLHAARTVAEANIPILGVNLGRLGFLVDVSPDEIKPRLQEYLGGEFITESRSLLETRVNGHETYSEPLLALNDVVLHKTELARMIEFDAHINDKPINAFRADGLVIATPTGSTAYSLSAGGPIVQPSLDATILVPICPHTLNNRPLVISADSNIRLTVKPQDISSTMLTLDGQTRVVLHDGCEVTVRRYPQAIQLVHPRNYDYFDILRAKLNWGDNPSSI